jgi:hypothetical protein
MKLTLLAVLFLVAGFAYADSDAIGILAGTEEKFSLALYNSVGELDSNGSCSIGILNETSVTVFPTNMTNEGSGFYSYNWSVPDASGTYRVLMNCTTSESLNYSAGGALYVSPRSFEKTVARGVVLNGPNFIEQYGIAEDASKTEVLSTPWISISLGAGILIIIGLLLYIVFKKR